MSAGIYKTKEQFLDCDCGIYRIFWKSGGSSVASIGRDHVGNRWIAPANWSCPVKGNPTGMLSDCVDHIEMMLKFG